jgi:hypothetical protein
MKDMISLLGVTTQKTNIYVFTVRTSNIIFVT